MKISVRNLEPTKVKLTVTVDPEEFNPYLDEARKEIAKQVNVPGFRKGHVPGKIIDQRIGFGAVAGEAVNNGVPELYSKALETKKIHPMAQPEIDVQDVPESAKDETKLKFVATVERRPDIELPALDGMEIEVAKAEVTDEDINNRLEALRQRFGTLVSVDRPAAKGDYANIDLEKAWDLEEGNRNVVVAVMDGAVEYTHPDLAANCWVNEAELNGLPGVDDDGNGYVDDIYGWNFIYSSAYPMGSNRITPVEHGTHVAGTIAAENGNGIGVCGVAGGRGGHSGVRVISCQMFTENRNDNGDEIVALKYGADAGAVISQNSWGYTAGTISVTDWTRGSYSALSRAMEYFNKYAGLDENGNQTGPMAGGIVLFAAGNDASSDLAVIKLKDADASKLTPIEIGDSSKLNVGEWVMAIGSPFGNEQSVSTGIVSALYRSTAMSSTNGNTIYANMIQTDAAINPGNSGGALVNDNGELVGINSLIESYSGSSSGVGFAIPVNYAKNIADQIIDGKTPVHPYLGATLSSVNALNARTNKLSTDSGAYVASVVEDGPAAKAGIQEGDVITKLGDDEITSADGLIIALRSHEVGEKVEITLMRGKEEKKVTVELGSDEELQNQQQDDSSTDTGNGGITDEQLRQYLEELLGQQGQGQGAGTAGILDAGGVGVAHVDHGQHVQQARTAAPPDDAAGHFAGHAVLAAQHARGGDAVLGLHVDLAVQQQVADAGQAHQMDALFRVGDGAGRQLQLGAHLPVGGGAAYLEPDGGLPAGDLHLVAVLVGQFLAGDALERGLGRGALAKSQQGAEGPGGIDAELTARHTQTAFLH